MVNMYKKIKKSLCSFRFSYLLVVITKNWWIWESDKFEPRLNSQKSNKKATLSIQFLDHYEVSPHISHN